MVYQLVGISHFTSKAGKQVTALHLIDSKPLSNGSGHAVVTKVTSVPVDCSLGKVDVTYNDRGFVESVKAI